MAQLINKDSLVAEIERLQTIYNDDENIHHVAKYNILVDILSFIDTLEVEEVDVSDISENLAEAYEYLDFTSTGNLAHNKPMVSGRLKMAIQGLFDAGLFELTHDKKYRMENLGLKSQKGE